MIRPLVSAALLVGVALVALATYAHGVARAAFEQRVTASNRAAAIITRELVATDFAHWRHTLEGVARHPALVEAVEARDAEAVRGLLGVLVESQPRVDRAFVTDPAGLLWSDHPRAPESLGRRFDDRDWYRGLSGRWETHVSTVYRRWAEPRHLLVAVATPVRGEGGGPVVGALVYQVELSNLRALLREVDAGEGGYVVLLDPEGQVAAHPRLDLQARVHGDYVETPVYGGAGDDDVRSLRYVDPITGQDMLAAVATLDLGGRTWTVIAQQPAAVAFAPMSRQARQIGGAGLLLAVVMTGFGLALARESAHRQRAEDALRASHDALEERVAARTRELEKKDAELRQAQKLEAVGLLAGGIAHDFNNLLSVMLGYANLLLDDLREDDPRRPDVLEIRDAAERASDLTRQLLAFSRKQILQPEVLDLNAIVDRTSSMLKRLIGEDVDLVTRLAPDLEAVKADPGQIEQVLMNLAVNARDAMPHGGKLTIETANVVLDDDFATRHPVARSGPHVMIAVTDTGTGMDARTQERLFEPFFTTKGVGRGTGLGLSTVHGIVEQSGGCIYVYSELGVGTSFKVYLPSVDEVPAPPPERQVEPSHPVGEGSVLVVEDDAAVRGLVARVLDEAGYAVLAATDPDAAIDLCTRHEGRIDVLLTDVIMPRLNGPALARILCEARPDLRVLYMSGYTDNAIVHHGVLDPGTAFLEKPIRPQALVDAVAAVLAGEPGAEQTG